MADSRRGLTGAFERAMCPCCEYLTLSRRGVFERCPVCRWIDDPTSGMGHGRNPVSLLQAQLNFQAFGAAWDEERINVRKPRPHEHPL
jgi:hypothetical protein